MIVALLLAALPLSAADAPPSAVDAERAFAEDAQLIGQWTAFRKWSAADAVLFTPQPVNAHEFLKDKGDPAEAVHWWPGESYISCDQRFAVNTGGWSGKGHGYFTTVWRREGDTWRWIYDGGDALQAPRLRPEQPKARGASCERVTARIESGSVTADLRRGGGSSEDGSLVWSWSVEPNGARTFQVHLWNGSSYERVIEDKITGE